jgi:lipopolysaccharide heptosyltransferase II
MSHAIDPGPIRHVLIRANNWIGDVVMISPAVRALRARFAGARIAILAKSWVLETLQGSPDYDDLIEYDAAGRHKGLGGRARLAAALRRRHFDLAVLFQKAFEAAALAFLAGARVRVGYATDGRRLLLTHALPLPPSGTHHVDQFLGLARALGCPVIDPVPSFHLDQDARHEADHLLRQTGWVERSPLVALHPGASKPPRAWHEQRFGELARRLASRTGGVILLGGPGERDRLERMAAGSDPGRILIPPRVLPIKVVGALLQRCHLFVGNDSGPMHVAAALGVPTVALFGPGSPSRTAPVPRGGPVTIIGRNYPCSPCRQDFFRECSPAPSGKPFCLEEIQVDEVEQAALDLLHRSGPGRSPG